MNSAWIHEAAILFNASLYKDSELCFKIYLVCFRSELKGFWEEQPSVNYFNDLLEGGEDADLGESQRKSGLCKWLTAVGKPQQKGIKADMYLRAVKRGRIWWWEEQLQTLQAGIMKHPVPTEARRQMTKAETKWWCGFWRAQNLQTFNMPLKSVCMLSLWVSKCLVSPSAFLWEPRTQCIGSGFISQGLN